MKKKINSLADNTLEYTLIRSRSSQLKIRKLDKARLSTRVLVLLLLSITLLTFLTMDMGTLVLSESIPRFFINIQRIFLQPRLSHRVEWSYLFENLLITIGLAMISTLLSTFISLFFALLVARNLSPKLISKVIRVLISLIRTIPAILWALVFSLAMGLGAEAAIIGLMFQGTAFLSKAYSETIEEMDKGVIEALKASGASWWQIVFQAVLPSCLTAMLAWTFIRIESNFSHAVAVGAMVGAGGIGFRLILRGNMNFDLHEVGTIVYLLMIVSMFFECISVKLRKRLLSKK